VKITAKQMFATGPCPDYTLERITELWADRESISLLDITYLDISVEDVIWAVTQFFDAKTNRLLAADYAESVLHLWTAEYPDDDRLALVIKAARDFANGKISREQLNNARAAVWAAAWAAARDAAMDAAWAAAGAAWAAAGAARDAAWDAARGAVRDAAWDAAMAAARDDEEKKQLAILRRYCQVLEGTK